MRKARKWELAGVAVLTTGLVGAAALTAPAAMAAGTAAIEICKAASGTGVSGLFTFTVAGQSVSVPVGDCSPTLQIPAGSNTITEVQKSGFQLVSVTSDPDGRVTSVDLDAQTATVDVPESTTANETVFTFTNEVAPTGFIEICKHKPDGDPLTGSFDFTIDGSSAGSVAVGSCSTAQEVATGNHTVAEVERTGTQLVSITGTPDGTVSDVNLTNRSATATVNPGAITVVTFTNQTAPQHGTLKVCKVAGTGVQTGQEFTFSVDSGTPFQVAAGSCSDTMTVTAGNHVVTEAAATGYSVSAITTTPSGALVSSDLADRTATVAVPADTVVDVSFTNVRSTGQLKVCKIAGDGVTAGQEFPFSVDGGATFTVPAGSCTFPMTMDTGHHTVTEGTTDGFQATDISVQSGSAGSLVSSDLANQSAVVDVEPGVTVLNVTNAAKPPTPPVTGCTRTKGYYKTHEAVTTQLVGSGLTIGGRSLSASQVLDILNRTEKGGNIVLQVEQQLITALLNQRAGASSTPTVDTAIAAAQKLIAENGGALNPSGRGSTTVTYNGTTYTASELNSILDAYNNGLATGGPASCG